MYYSDDKIYKTVESVYLNGKKLKKRYWYTYGNDKLCLDEKLRNRMKNKKNQIIVHYIEDYEQALKILEENDNDF